MNSGPVRLCLIGCGAISQLHYVPALRELARAGIVEPKLLVDPSAECLAAVGRHFPGARTAASMEELDASIEAAIVASPASLHAQHANGLLALGRHVLCEKPMAATLEQCEAMLSAAERHGRLLAVGLFRRYFPAVQQMRQLIASNALGSVQSFEITEGGRFQWRARTDSFFRKSTGGGGVLLDIGVHVLDLMVWWFGDPLDVTYEDDAMGGVEANCRIFCKFHGGLAGSIRLSRDWNLRNRYFVRFERGWAAWNPADPVTLEVGFGGRRALNAKVHEAGAVLGLPAVGELGTNYYQSFMGQIENFARAVRGQAQLEVPGEEGIRSVRLIERLYRNARLMPMPWLSSAEAQAAEALRC